MESTETSQNTEENKAFAIWKIESDFKGHPILFFMQVYIC